MKPAVWLLFCSLSAWSPSLLAQNHDSSSGFVHIQAVDVSYQPVPDIPGLSYAVLSGDPDKEGVYVIRLKISPGLTFPPHHHDQDRHVTVISGVWAFGTGDSGKCEDTTPLNAGAYVMHPKGAVHFDGACGDETVEVQIIGLGPVSTTWAEEVK